eukprot:3871478-Rhodomonas_salina.1
MPAQATPLCVVPLRTGCGSSNWMWLFELDVALRKCWFSWHVLCLLARVVSLCTCCVSSSLACPFELGVSLRAWRVSSERVWTLTDGDRRSDR